VFFGRGDGSFDPVVTYDGVVGTPGNLMAARFGDPAQTDLVIFDFQAPTDGNARVLVASISTGRVLTVVASLPQAQATDYNEGLMSVADLNGDGVPDFLVGLVVDSMVAEIAVLVSNPDGGWSSKGYVPDWADNNDFVGDFNEDGVPDVVAMAPTDSPNLSLFLGKGDGTFSAGTVVATANGTEAILAIGDLNGDGHLDILLSNQSLDVGWTPYLGRGDGTFVAGTSVDLGNWPFGKRVGLLWDLNGDGYPDYVGIRYWASQVGARRWAMRWARATGPSRPGYRAPTSAAGSAAWPSPT
jgi:hypothetical protein